MNTTHPITYPCGCGDWTGYRCNWTGPADEMIVVEWMPEHLRASHEAAGNSGCWPHNGSERIAVKRSCADLLMEDDEEEWAQTLPDLDPATYAEREES